MGFSGLRTFGPSLIHHTQLKVRKEVAIKVIIDQNAKILCFLLQDVTFPYIHVGI